MKWFSPRRIYLDYAAATPVLPEVERAMRPYWSENFYNPNAIYAEGEEVKKVIGECTTRIARMLNVAKENIIFTSGGTEANVLALEGVRPGRVILDGEVHPSVLESVKEFEGGPTLVSSTTTSNKLGRQVRSEGNILHIDASQTAGYYNVGLEQLSCDLLTLDAAKIGGPKGCGLLVVGHRASRLMSLPPRGTPAVPLIVGFTKALEVACHKRESEYERLSNLSRIFVEILKRDLPEAEVSQKWPNQIYISVPNILPELLVLALDKEGVMVSAGPACESSKPEPKETPVRISLGRNTTESEVREGARIFCQVAKKLVKCQPNAAV